ncbi:MAG: ATP-binding cassette domain-containing protein [Nocardioidaceae bacterium]|nr:MAG: ATP-binding cassette domain-containing protein [Nocardioidaceae bacterium]
MLEIRGLSTGYGRLTVVRDANLTVAEGEIVAIVGPNGAGKSSLMKAVARSLSIFEGQVLFRGQDIGSLPQNQIAGLGIGYILNAGMCSRSCLCWRTCRSPTGEIMRKLANRRSESSTSSRGCGSAPARRPARCPVANARCWRSRARCWPSRRC